MFLNQSIEFYYMIFCWLSYSNPMKIVNLRQQKYRKTHISLEHRWLPIFRFSLQPKPLDWYGLMVGRSHHKNGGVSAGPAPAVALDAPGPQIMDKGIWFAKTWENYQDFTTNTHWLKNINSMWIIYNICICICKYICILCICIYIYIYK